MPCITIPFDPRRGAIATVGFTKPTDGVGPEPGQSPIQALALIDAGATRTCISPMLAQQIGVHPQSKVKMATAAGIVPANVYLVDFYLPFVLPGQTSGLSMGASNLEVMEVPLVANAPYQALLGLDVLGNSLFQIVGYDKRCTICM